ncbi:NUDIX domain-containing protein [Paenibacillus sp. MMS20-IR301]|uniref:NUDIX hydrolase n=1 Tax=Paenibacillus sp. MMS20-IR301 TaxID=2895946 RepID=UPI0028E1AA59|nr:NUDIX domain-containing protein [Paenibacillus sp. MMS20-IR301]WNS45813.1 NUDIX domain-containing protein [Paenibacillus sp. MMS20-IR301]
MMNVTIYDTEVPEAGTKLKYVVIAMKQGEDWVLVRHRERFTWEFAGGHIDEGESPDEAAARELYEETGAEVFELYPICRYSVRRGEVPESYGMLYFAAVDKFGPLPPFEMEEIRRFSEIPEDVTYPEIYPVLLSKIKDYLKSGF